MDGVSDKRNEKQKGQFFRAPRRQEHPARTYEMLQIPCRVDRLLRVDSQKPEMAVVRIAVSHSHEMIGREREKHKTKREEEKTSAYLQDRAGVARRQRPASWARSFLAKVFPSLLFQPDAQPARGFSSFSQVFAILSLVESMGGRGREGPRESIEERRGTKEKEKEKKQQTRTPLRCFHEKPS